MERLRNLIKSITGETLSDTAIDDALGKNGDPTKRLAVDLARKHWDSWMPERDIRRLERDYHRMILPLRPVFCFLREQKRDKVQRMFERLEATVDRSTPPAGPEIPHFFVSEKEEDDAIYPEELEEIKHRKLVRQLKRIRKERE